MTPQELITYFRTPTNAARALRIKAPSIYGWIEAGEIPIDRQCQAEVITSGALRADRQKLGMQPAAPEPQQQAAYALRRRQMGG